MFFRKILTFITITTLALSLFIYSPKTVTAKAQTSDFNCLTYLAIDYLENASKPTTNVTAAEKDTVAPELLISIDEAFVKIGTTPIVNVKATDNVDKFVQIVMNWSEGALDSIGKLTEGVHVLTIIATDASGNSTVKTITFYVSENGDEFENVIDEEELCPDVESEEESKSQKESGNDKNTSSTKSCQGSLTTLPFLSLLTLCGLVTLIKKRK